MCMIQVTHSAVVCTHSHNNNNNNNRYTYTHIHINTNKNTHTDTHINTYNHTPTPPQTNLHYTVVHASPLHPTLQWSPQPPPGASTAPPEQLRVKLPALPVCTYTPRWWGCWWRRWVGVGDHAPMLGVVGGVGGRCIMILWDVWGVWMWEAMCMCACVCVYHASCIQEQQEQCTPQYAVLFPSSINTHTHSLHAHTPSPPHIHTPSVACCS